MSEGQGPTGLERANLDLAKNKTGAESGVGLAKGSLREGELADWLIKPEEYKKLKAGLKPLVEIIGGRPDEANTIERLNSDRDKIEGLVLNGQAKIEDIRPFLQRIDKKIAENTKKESVVPQAEKLTPQEVKSLIQNPELLISKLKDAQEKLPGNGDETSVGIAPSEKKANVTQKRFDQATAVGPSLAEQMGIMPPEQQLDIVYRPIERRGQIAMNVAQPLSFEVMFEPTHHPEMPNTEAAIQHENYRIRFSNFMSGAAQKAVADSVDAVMNPVPKEQAKLDPLGVEFKKADIEFLFRNQPGTLQATSIWTTIIGGREYVAPTPKEGAPPDIREKLLNFYLKKYKDSKKLKEEKTIYKDNLKNLGFSGEEIEKLLNSDLIYEKNRLKVLYGYDKDKKEEERFSVTKNLEKDFSRETQYLKHLIDLGFSDKEELRTLVMQRQKLLEGRDGCPASFWAADEPTFERVRDSVQYWLKTEGRHYLYLRRMVPVKDENGKPFKMETQKEWKRAKNHILTLQSLGIPSEEIRKSLKEVRLSKQLSLKELEGLAKDAEQPAWNFVFTVGLVESFNTEEACWWLRHMAKGVKGPSNHMTLYLWMGLHPVQRWTNKIMAGAKELKDEDGKPRLEINLKENWSSLGVWGTNNIAQMSLDPKKAVRGNKETPWTFYKKFYVNDSGEITSKLILVTPKFLRPDLVKDGFRHEDSNKKALFDRFTEIGNKILNNPKEFPNNDYACDKGLFYKKIEKRDKSGKIKRDKSGEAQTYMPWEDELSTTPFVNYRFDYLRWALASYMVFKKGSNSERDVSYEDIQEAFYRLNFSYDERMRFLVFREGINNMNRSIIEPTIDGLKWKAVLFSLQNNPSFGLTNLFKNEKVGEPVEKEFDWDGYPEDDETKLIRNEWLASRAPVRGGKF